MKKKKKNVFREKMLEGYDNLSDFVKRSGIFLSAETCRKFIYEQSPINTLSFVVICHYLSFSPNEIKALLAESATEGLLRSRADRNYAKMFVELIGDSDVSLTAQDKAVLRVAHKLHGGNKEVFFQVIDYVSMVAKVIGVNIDEEVAALGRGK